MATRSYSINPRGFQFGVLPVVVALLLSSCNSGNDQPIIVLPSDEGPSTVEPPEGGTDTVDEPEGGMDTVDEPDGGMDTVDEPDGGPDTVDEPAAPLDPDGDDRPGMVVTGLNGTPASDISSVWHVNMSLFRLESLTPGSGDATVSLLQYENPVTMESHINFYAPVLDTCEIRDLDEETGDGSGGGGGTSPRVSGGSTLTINTQSGPLVVLPSVGDDPGFYGVDNEIPGALPADATLSIPGDQFPSVAAYPLVEPAVPVRISPAAGVLSDADVMAPFTWVAVPNKPGGYFRIVALAYREDNSFAGFPVICSVVDDGEFSMPAEVIQAFASNTTLRIETRFERSIKRFDLINDIAFHQRSIVGE